MDVMIDHAGLKQIGVVRSPLVSRKGAPRQGHLGAPEATVEVAAEFADALLGVSVGDWIIVLTWLHQARREVLQVRPGHDPARALAGVFATRSPDRPNPIGLHRVQVLSIDGTQLGVGPIEAIDGTPVVDIKPVMKDCVDS
jgi:tRNA-Thr(GGU) m(6)t(6)A37 methyltransferase TsaA